MESHELFIKFIITGGFFIMGKCMAFLALIPIIPQELIGWFQIGSYGIAMLVGSITIYKFFKEK